jgi:hypothetical protein
VSAHLWRVDRVVRTRDGEVIAQDPGKPVQSYDRARGDFDAAFAALPPGQSVRLVRAEYDLGTQELRWVTVREGWQGR